MLFIRKPPFLALHFGRQGRQRTSPLTSQARRRAVAGGITAMNERIVAKPGESSITTAKIEPNLAIVHRSNEAAFRPGENELAARTLPEAAGARAAERSAGSRSPFPSPSWIPWIFAGKTTASGLLALLVAFAFNLDQPKWALLTVFIVAQPQSGLVLAKSFFRIVGTVVGAAVALLLVSLFAQERVLFLGSLALWIGLCTFASKYARNFAAYGFVLSGYTVAIVGITGALDPTNAFFIAVDRATEISLGIMTTAVISRVILPMSLSDALRRTIAAGRTELADYAASL